MADEPEAADKAPRANRRTLWIVAGLVAAILMGVLLASSVWDERFKDEEQAPANEAAAASKPDIEKWCAAQAT
jgi:hypothetical protein